MLAKLGYVRSRCHSGVYLRYVGSRIDDVWVTTMFDGVKKIETVLYVHVDDLIAFRIAGAEAALLEIGCKVKLKAPPTCPDRVLGFNVAISQEGIVVDQHTHALNLPVRVVKGKLYDKPLPMTLRKELQTQKQLAGDEPCSEEQHARYRKILGILLFLRHTRQDVLYALSYLGRYLSAPSIRHLRMCETTARYVKATAWYGLRFSTSEVAIAAEMNGFACDYAVYREKGGAKGLAASGEHTLDCYMRMPH